MCTHHAGIAAQETAKGDTHGDTYIPATYIKYLELAGARVVPVRSVQGSCLCSAHGFSTCV